MHARKHARKLGRTRGSAGVLLQPFVSIMRAHTHTNRYFSSFSTRALSSPVHTLLLIVSDTHFEGVAAAKFKTPRYTNNKLLESWIFLPHPNTTFFCLRCAPCLRHRGPKTNYNDAYYEDLGHATTRTIANFSSRYKLAQFRDSYTSNLTPHTLAA